MPGEIKADYKAICEVLSLEELMGELSLMEQDGALDNIGVDICVQAYLEKEWMGIEIGDDLRMLRYAAKCGVDYGPILDSIVHYSWAGFLAADCEIALVDIDYEWELLGHLVVKFFSQSKDSRIEEPYINPALRLRLTELVRMVPTRLKAQLLARSPASIRADLVAGLGKPAK